VEHFQDVKDIWLLFLGPVDVGGFGYFEHGCGEKIFDGRFRLQHHVVQSLVQRLQTGGDSLGA